MQRDRHDYVCVIQKTAAGAIQPAGEPRNQVEPVCVLECQNGTAAIVVIAHDSTGPVEGWRVSETGRTGRADAGIEVKRQSATLAGRAI